MPMPPAASFPQAAPRARSKVVAGLLACSLGWLGAHWWYLGRRGAWLLTLACGLCLLGAQFYTPWYDNPVFFLLFIPTIAGFIEGVVYSLMPDERFDRLFNPGLGPVSRTGWGAVLVALFGGLVGSVVAMFAIAMVVVYVWTAMGWLDGYTL